MTYRHKSTLFALLFFALATLIMTYPQIFNMGSGLGDLGDALLNTWILSFNVYNITHLNIGDFFDSNIFYPHRRTLAYSEHLFTQSLVALPVSLFIRNPVFIYNFVLLFSFFTSGLGMYFLARYLTRNSRAGLIAGIIYGFSPFMFAHFFHAHIITAGGIPLSFLFLHRFFEQKALKDLMWFTLFFILQVLANGYYALYLLLFSGLYFLFFLFYKKVYKDRDFWLKVILALVIVLICVGPFYSQYIHVKKEMGFSRVIGSYASLKSFLSTPPMNRIYGPITFRFWKPEAQLFPGLLAFLLALFGGLLTMKNNRRRNSLLKNPAPLYAAILVLSFSFTFGPKGPYILLYKFVPGFDGLRAAARIHIFVMFSLAVLAAYGFKKIEKKAFNSTKKSIVFFVGLLFFMFIEYLSLPVPLNTIQSGKNIPEIYTWLSQRKDIRNLIELPLPKPKESISALECPRIFYSIFHKKNMVNGYSGYFPPLYDELRRRWQSGSVDQNIKDLEVLGVDHILVHSNEYQKEEYERWLSGLQGHKDRVRFVDEIGETLIFKILYPSQKMSFEFKTPRILSRENWTVKSSKNNEMTAYAIDGDMDTRWHSGPQTKETSFELNLGQPFSIQGFSLKLGDKPLDYPRGIRVELSTDCKSWKKVLETEITVLPITAYLKPKKLALVVRFPRIESQYIRIVNTGEHRVYYWSIFEIDVFR